MEEVRNPTDFRDLDLNDFRHIADYFAMCNTSPASTPAPLQPLVGDSVLGVRINCQGDQNVLKKPQFEIIRVLPTDEIFSVHDESGIAQRISLPIFTRTLRSDPSWDNDTALFTRTSFNNQAATFLHLCCDPHAEWDELTGQSSWGFASAKWQNRVGSIAVMRQDKKDLLPLHMEAICNFCQSEMLPHFSDCEEIYPEAEQPARKDVVLAMLSRPTFKTYWEKFLKTKGGTDKNTLYHYISPYEVRVLSQVLSLASNIRVARVCLCSAEIAED